MLAAQERIKLNQYSNRRSQEPFGLLDDQKIRRYFELGCEVKGLGRGHVKRIKDEVWSKANIR